MGKLSDRLESDLKQAMLARDSQLVSIIRGLKSALQYAQVAQGAGSQLSEEDTVKTLQKESKKRADAASIYRKANDSERAEQEEYEQKVIDAYLPELMGREEVAKLVDEVIGAQEELTAQSMGRIISEVREKSNGLAEGSLIAELVKERLAQ